MCRTVVGIRLLDDRHYTLYARLTYYTIIYVRSPMNCEEYNRDGGLLKRAF
jgi:hypothetical protein